MLTHRHSNHMVVLKFTIMESGAQCVMMVSPSLRPHLLADNSDFPEHIEKTKLDF